MELAVVGSSFALLFLAEMGDKTQLMAMTLAHRYRALPVIVGVFSAFLLLNLLAVLVGEVLFRYVPRNAVLVIAGALFLFFAWKSWRDANGAEDGEAFSFLGVYTLMEVYQSLSSVPKEYIPRVVCSNLLQHLKQPDQQLSGHLI